MQGVVSEKGLYYIDLMIVSLRILKFALTNVFTHDNYPQAFCTVYIPKLYLLFDFQTQWNYSVGKSSKYMEDYFPNVKMRCNIFCNIMSCVLYLDIFNFFQSDFKSKDLIYFLKQICFLCFTYTL